MNANARYAASHGRTWQFGELVTERAPQRTGWVFGGEPAERDA